MKNAPVMDKAEFTALLDRFGKETIRNAETRGRNGALAAMTTIVRRARMNETTKTWLLNQIAELRRPQEPG